ncbi:staygreen family protein [Priestia megaterium]
MYVYVFIGNEQTEKSVQAIRYAIFKQEMPYLLKALRYGDATFFNAHPALDRSPFTYIFIPATKIFIPFDIFKRLLTMPKHMRRDLYFVNFLFSKLHFF